MADVPCSRPTREDTPDARLKWLWTAMAVTPIFFFIPITHDAAWQMWVGRQLAHGANLYQDVVEVNPPLWFWISAPLSYVAEMLGLQSLAVLVAFFIGAIGFALWLSLNAAPRSVNLWPVAVATLYPIQHFAQREHFTLIATIPYVLLIARRERGEAVSRSNAVLIGSFAAVGFALKPHFAAVPLMLELWAWRLPKIRPETLTLGTLAFTYSLALVAVEPDYLSTALPLVLAAYAQFSPIRLEQIFPSVIALLFAAPLLLSARGAAGACAVAALTFWLIFLLQLKGWAYQAVPALGLLLVAALLAAGRSPVARAVAAAVAIIIIVPSLRPYETPKEYRLAVPRGATFAALSVAPRAAWPLVEERQLEWPLPYISMWMVPAVRPDVRHELLCNPPDFLLVDDREVNFSSELASILRSYTRTGGTDEVSYYKRTAALPPATGCRTIY